MKAVFKKAIRNKAIRVAKEERVITKTVKKLKNLLNIKHGKKIIRGNVLSRKCKCTTV